MFNVVPSSFNLDFGKSWFAYLPDELSTISCLVTKAFETSPKNCFRVLCTSYSALTARARLAAAIAIDDFIIFCLLTNL